MTTQKMLKELRDFEITEEEVELLREIRGSLKDEKDREAFLELVRESPFLLTFVRKLRAGLTSYDLIRKIVLWFLAAIVAVNLFSSEIGKLVGWLGQFIQR